MKKSLVLAMAMALGVTASAYAANPFSDVPAGHWAYDSIDKLAAAGVIEGMGDGTYQGDKTMTRYEMAQIVAKAMAKGANVDKLAAEFADELDNLGVRVANLEKKADNVKITGNIRYHYTSAKNTGKTPEKQPSGSTLRSRLTVKGQINDSWTYTALLQNEQKFSHNNASEETDVKFQRAYVNGRIGGLAVQAGRYAWTDITGGNIHDTRVDGVQVSYGKKVQVTAMAMKTGTSTGANKNSKTYGAEAATKFGVVGAHGAYYRFEDAHGLDKVQVATVGVAAPVAKDVQATADYIRASKDANGGKNGAVVGLNYKGATAAKAGSWGLFAKYYNQAENTIIAHTMNGVSTLDGGIKGYQVGANYTFAKNIVGEVQYYDLKAKQGSDKARTLWSQVVLTF